MFPMDISTGNIYFYCNLNTQFMCRLIIEMDCLVSGECLQKAVGQTMKRYPYFCAKAVLHGVTYAIEKNELPFIVYEGEEFISPGDPRINGHLISFAYHGNKIYLDFFHGIADGGGIKPLTDTLFYYYCTYFYEETPDSHNINLSDDAVDGRELIDPMTCRLPEVVPFQLNLPKTAFALPLERVKPETPRILYPVRVMQKELMQYVKSVDSSPVSIFALFMCKAIDALHPGHEEPIVCATPMNVRGVLGTEKTFRNCVSSIYLKYSPEIQKMPTRQQAMRFRGQLILQSAPEHLIPAIAKEYKKYEALKQLPSLKDKFTACIRSAMENPTTLYCSYPGKIVPRFAEKHVRSAHYFLNMGNSVVMEIIATGDYFDISVIGTCQIEPYVQEFIHQMRNEKISAVLGETISFKISDRCF